MTTLSKGQQVAADVSALLRARNPLLWIVTKEEARVEGYIGEAAAQAGYIPRVWDIAQGVCKLNGTKDTVGGADPSETFAAIQSKADDKNGKERGVWIMRDLSPWISGPGNAKSLRELRNLARSLPGAPRERAQAIIVLSTSGDVPPELANHATVIDFPMPDRSEIEAILDAALEPLKADIKKDALPAELREAAIDAAVGLTGEEAAACYARSLVQTKKIDPKLVANEKKRVVAREKVLEWYDPIPGGLAAVGGLENIKAWLLARASAFTPEARAYGLPSPKGIVVVGVSGCGKSLLSKCIATAWGCPLLRLDLGALKGKFVGESEGNLRKALRVIEAIGRCVVWLDEVEKALQGATSGSADGGVSADALGTILTWMEENKSGAFVIATANDVSALPPEFLRKGRFNDIFFVDTPNAEERVSVLKAALTANGRADVKIDLTEVADACDGFTGAEIAAIVPDAMYSAFGDGIREIATPDLLAAAKLVVPLTVTAAEKIKTLREWARDRARPAARVIVEEVTRARGRQLDV